MSTADAGILPVTASEELETGLPCPLCGYDLRGLPQGRCPECGHAFDPADLREAQRKAAQRPVPWLVEYPPPGWFGFLRNLLATRLLTHRPLLFWNRLRPTMPPHPGLLLAYGVWSAIFLLAVPVAILIWPVQSDFLSIYLWSRGGARGGEVIAHSLIWLLLACWPWLTLGLLASFRLSLRQAKISNAHLLRCVLYSGNLCLVSLLLLIGGIAVLRWSPLLPYDLLLDDVEVVIGVPPPLLVMVVGALLWFWVRLSIAYHRYLAFPHALATVASTQVILWLTLFILTLWRI